MPFNFRKYAATIALGAALVVPAYALNSLSPQDRDQGRQDQGRDRDRGDRDYSNSKLYKEGFKDGGPDRDKRRSARFHKKRFKNDRDREAYEAGYNSAYRGDRH